MFQFEAVSKLTNYGERESYVIETLNSDEDVDVRLMEATKALMMADVLSLHKDNCQGKPVPTFVWLMFARDSSLNPKDFFLNHLDGVGDSYGLEMVCLCTGYNLI